GAGPGHGRPPLVRRDANVRRINLFKHFGMWAMACPGARARGGCGPAAVDDLPRQAVWGKVTLDGQPLEQGTITFTPATGSPTPGMVSITGGSYSIPQAQGLVPGPYKVSILSKDATEPVENFGHLPGIAP